MRPSKKRRLMGDTAPSGVEQITGSTGALPNPKALVNRLPPFDFKRTRDVYHGDRSVTTTVRVTAFYRAIEVSYNRPLRDWREQPTMKEGDE